jgi:RHS repeat-associated protein
VDLLSGELLEVSTYYPNGARETLRTNSGAAVPLEPMGFTGKEADEDVGLVYFGERYLLARLGRWASADPLHVHASGGGEALNSYHYVSGNLLQARDPLGLNAVPPEPPPPDEVGETHTLPDGSASEPSTTVGASESFTRIDAPDFAPGTVEDSLEGLDWAMARVADPSAPGGTRMALFYGLESVGAWTEYREGMFDGRVEHDPVGQFFIDLIAGGLWGAYGAEMTALREAAAARGESVVFASLPAPATARAGAYSAPGGVVGAFVGPIRQAGEYLALHSSGLMSRIVAGAGGRLQSVEAILDRAFLDAGTATTSSARAMARGMGTTADDAGHAIAARLGGSGGAGSGNIFAQLSSVNRGIFRDFEALIAQHVESGADVSVRLSFNYADDAATRPTEILYEAWINGTRISTRFNN